MDKLIHTLLTSNIEDAVMINEIKNINFQRKILTIKGDSADIIIFYNPFNNMPYLLIVRYRNVIDNPEIFVVDGYKAFVQLEVKDDKESTEVTYVSNYMYDYLSKQSS